jgi:protein-S-isoprenylcysteine O-methyltransferase Ste14
LLKMIWMRRIVPPAWLLAALIVCLALHHWLPLVQLCNRPWSQLGMLPLLAGLILAVCGVSAFRRAGTPLVPFVPSTALVTTGIYRFTRNPMYLGLTLILAGTALILGSLGALLPLVPFVLILRCGYIDAEERFLENIFGSEYRRYKTAVRRWI